MLKSNLIHSLVSLALTMCQVLRYNGGDKIDAITAEGPPWRGDTAQILGWTPLCHLEQWGTGSPQKASCCLKDPR